ncbi:MAG: hypothetical protein WDN06_07585 [Asticcacaulis sp.]
MEQVIETVRKEGATSLFSRSRHRQRIRAAALRRLRFQARRPPQGLLQPQGRRPPADAHILRLAL